MVLHKTINFRKYGWYKNDSLDRVDLQQFREQHGLHLIEVPRRKLHNLPQTFKSKLEQCAKRVGLHVKHLGVTDNGFDRSHLRN